jgi:hypothetical protein
LRDCEPNVIGNLDIILSKTDKLIIKTSPIYDIQAGLRELKSVKEIHVVSVKNDCKELLWVLDNVKHVDPKVVVSAFLTHELRTFEFLLSEEKQARITEYSDPLTYLYEPDAAVLKAGCFKLLTTKFDIEKLNVNTGLYTSTRYVENFIGRTFKVSKTLVYKDFSKATNPIRKANIICRNFPHSPEEIKKKHKISDGGETYLIFTTGASNTLLTLIAERI